MDWSGQIELIPIRSKTEMLKLEQREATLIRLVLLFFTLTYNNLHFFLSFTAVAASLNMLLWLLLLNI